MSGEPDPTYPPGLCRTFGAALAMLALGFAAVLVGAGAGIFALGFVGIVLVLFGLMGVLFTLDAAEAMDGER